MSTHLLHTSALSLSPMACLLPPSPSPGLLGDIIQGQRIRLCVYDLLVPHPKPNHHRQCALTQPPRRTLQDGPVYHGCPSTAVWLWALWRALSTPGLVGRFIVEKGERERLYLGSLVYSQM